MIVLLQAACEPCAGVARCGADVPYLAATGRIVDKVTGKGIDGVQLDAVRRGGIAVGQDSLSTVTSEGGFWRIEFDSPSEGTLIADIRVSPPSGLGYTVAGLPLTARPNGGDANINQTWVSTPYFSYALELYRRGTSDERIRFRPVDFRLKSGVATVGTGVRDSVYSATSDGGGRVELFPQGQSGGVLPLGTADLVGDITVHLAAPLGPSVIRDVRLSPTYVYFGPVNVLRYAVGP